MSFGTSIFGSPALPQFNYRPNVYLQDSTDTTLPTGATPTIDGVLVANFQRVLFTNLTTGNNQVYAATGVGDPVNGVQWHLQIDGPGSAGGPSSAAPAPLDIIYVQDGTAHAGAFMGWTGSAWQNLFVSTNGTLQVTNAATATTPGTVTHKIQVFDANGTSLGYLAVYDAIA